MGIKLAPISNSRDAAVPHDLIRTMFAAIDACDWAALARHYGEDCVYERPGFETIRGLGGLVDFYVRLRPIRSGRHVVTRLLHDGGQVCAAGRFDGVLRTGEAIGLEFADLYTVRDQRIASRKTFFFTPLA